MPHKPKLSEHTRLREHATTGMPSPPPDFGAKFTSEHNQIWDQYVTCRAPADWDAGDLRLLAQAVLLETSILSAFAEVEHDGATIIGASGQKVINPAASALQKFMQSQGAILRRLGISVSGTVAPRDVRKNAELARKVGPTDRSDPVDDLLAH